MKNFRLQLLIVIVSIFSALGSHAQTASNYQFTALVDTFIPLTTGDTLNSILVDDRMSPTKPIGFNFYFAGNYYTHFKMSSNGILTFDTLLTASYNSNTVANSLLLSPGLMPLWDDISGSDASASAKYQVTGTAPNRKLVIELLNWRWNFSSAFPPTISFQIHLYEADGKIEYVYRREAGAGNFGSSGATIGIIDAANTFLNLDSATTNPILSSTVLTMDIKTRPVSGQIYRWEAIMCSPTTVYPDSIFTTSRIMNSCYGYYTELGFTSNTPFPGLGGLSYQWQKSTSPTGPWTNMGTPTLAGTTTIQVIDDAYYRFEILCNATNTGKFSQPIHLNYIQVAQPTSVNNFSRCGPGSQTLIANAPTGYKTIWYSDPNTLNPLNEGDTFVTNYVPTTTTFYAAAAELISNSDTFQIGVGTSTSGNTVAGPFNDYYRSRTMQIMYTAAELLAAGANNGIISTLGFDLVTLPTNPHADYRIAITQVPATQTTIAWQPDAAFTEVYYNPAFQPTTLGWNMLPLTSPFRWDGYSNIIVKICWTGGTTTSSTGTNTYTSVTGHMLHAFNNTDNFAGCTLTGASTVSTRPNVKFGIKTGCESARIPVVANINPSDLIDATFEDTTCTNVLLPIQLTTGIQAYDSFEWKATQANTLFIDANGTIPYTTGNPTTIYVKSSTTGLNSVTVFAMNTLTDCTHADTFQIEITATKPDVDLGGDKVICVDPGASITLDAENTGSSFLWDNNSTDQTRTIFQSGTYGVRVTNAYGCWSADTVKYEIKDNPISTLLSDTSVCEDVPVTLNPGAGGIQYFWNTGATQREITVDYPGNFIVQIVAANGCVVSDTATIINNGKLPQYDGIRVRTVDIRTFQFDVINPDYILDYNWDFGDGTTATAANPSHTYLNNGNYIVILSTTSDCGTRIDSSTVHIVSTTGINDITLDDNVIKVYPNPTNQDFNIKTEDGVLIEEVMIFAINGQLVYQNKLGNTNTTKVPISKLNSGMYQVKVLTNKGVAIKKLTVQR